MTTWKKGDHAGYVVRKAARPAIEIEQDPARRWFVVNAEHRREKTAEASIKDAGYLVYVPRYKVRARDRSRHRKWIQVERPLFGSYLFVAAAEGESAASRIEAARGVRALVRIGERLAAVPDLAIDKMRREQAHNFGQPYRAEQVNTDLAVGEAVRITDGAFSGFYAVIEAVVTGAIDGAAGITALASLFGREVKISGLTADQVERT